MREVSTGNCTFSSPAPYLSPSRRIPKNVLIARKECHNPLLQTDLPAPIPWQGKLLQIRRTLDTPQINPSCCRARGNKARLNDTRLAIVWHSKMIVSSDSRLERYYRRATARNKSSTERILKSVPTVDWRRVNKLRRCIANTISTFGCTEEQCSIGVISSTIDRPERDIAAREKLARERA